ncbi:hypothetical protein HGRIS_006261 [Hohenbuehelia grisea]|uniref:Sesquiterpene synthase n=1 Tax=Hohenbuehelia grisea TaxID=104357 RepID=A0ABR3JZM0_9AGAR
MTPLELLARDLRTKREFLASYNTPWSGHADEALVTKYIIKSAMGTRIGLPECAYIKQKKWGCTCNECACGWLSPRMCFRLQAVAALMMDDLEIPMQQERLNDVQIHASMALSYLPVDLRPSMDRQFVDGYMTLFLAICHTFDFSLPQADGQPMCAKPAPHRCIPTPSTIDVVVASLIAFEHKKENLEYFFDEGGKVEHALARIINFAADESTNPDCLWNQFEAAGPSDIHAAAAHFADKLMSSVQALDRTSVVQNFIDRKANWDSLPSCANDLEFGLLRERFNIPAGPFTFSPPRPSAA